MIQRQGLTGPQVTLKPCKECGALGHTRFTCSKRPSKIMRSDKPMNRIGKVGRATQASNKAFLNSISDSELYCYYCLYEGNEYLLPRREAQAEHFYSRARHPELRLDKTNLVISCGAHNKLKGSLDGPEFLEKLKYNSERETL